MAHRGVSGIHTKTIAFLIIKGRLQGPRLSNVSLLAILDPSIQYHFTFGRTEEQHWAHNSILCPQRRQTLLRWQLRGHVQALHLPKGHEAEARGHLGQHRGGDRAEKPNGSNLGLKSLPIIGLKSFGLGVGFSFLQHPTESTFTRRSAARRLPVPPTRRVPTWWRAAPATMASAGVLGPRREFFEEQVCLACIQRILYPDVYPKT